MGPGLAGKMEYLDPGLAAEDTVEAVIAMAEAEVAIAMVEVEVEVVAAAATVRRPRVEAAIGMGRDWMVGVDRLEPVEALCCLRQTA